MMFSFRLRTKFLLAIAGITILMGIVLTALVQSFVRESLSDEFKKRGVVLAEYAASMNANAILTGDLRTIQINLADLKREHAESIEYVFIIDRNNKVVAHTFADSFPIDLINANSLANGAVLSIQPIIAGEKLIEDIAIPSLGNGLGEVHVGIKEEIIQRDVDGVIFHILAAILCVLVVGIIVSILFSLRISRSISTLAAAALKIEGGDLTVQLETTGNDEIAELSRSFNDMCEGIRSREEKLHEQTVLLKEEIAERQQTQEALHEQTAQLEEEVAERRQAEEEIHRLNAELGHRVTERTSQLEAANKELEAFCYTVSHDLRAPLRHIDGYVDLLVSRCRDGLSDKGLHYVDTIAASARQMGTLIDDLLQFSRTGRAEMHLENMDMNQALKEALTMLQESSSGRAIVWLIADLPTVCGDYALLRQVWANLLENAVKYTRTRESARIEVSTREGDGEIIFVVADNGVGFEMQYAGKLFGVFQRLHSQEEFEGTGIGLATVQRIITRHGGRVWAEAEPDRGATFYFTLPTVQEENHV